MKSSWYRAPSLAWRPYRVDGRSAADCYIDWLAETRGWERKKASDYAHAQPHGRVLSATFGRPDNAPVVSEPKRKPRAKAAGPVLAPLSDRARAFALMLVEEFSRDKIDAALVAQAVIGLREALR